MGMLIPNRPELLVRSEPVCDQCGHGQGLHVEAADVECVVCVENGEGMDCPSFMSVGSPWGARSGWAAGVR